jgi:hypothetical protein
MMNYLCDRFWVFLPALWLSQIACGLIPIQPAARLSTNDGVAHASQHRLRHWGHRIIASRSVDAPVAMDFRAIGYDNTD